MYANIGEAAKALEAEIAQRFHVMDGPPQAYFELFGPGEKLYRLVYVTRGYTMASKELSPCEMEARICRRFIDDLDAAETEATGTPVWFWRIRPGVRVERGTEPGEIVVVVRMRCATPNTRFVPPAVAQAAEGGPLPKLVPRV